MTSYLGLKLSGCLPDPMGCYCSGHVLPGVSHIAPCCDTTHVRDPDEPSLAQLLLGETEETMPTTETVRRAIASSLEEKRQQYDTETFLRDSAVNRLSEHNAKLAKLKGEIEELETALIAP